MPGRPRRRNNEDAEEAAPAAPRRAAVADPEMSREKFDTTWDKVVVPFLPDLMAQHVQVAMGDDKVALAARIDILNRTGGMPTQRIEKKEERNVTLVVRPVTSIDQVASPDPDTLDVVDGQIVNLQLESEDIRELQEEATKQLLLVEAAQEVSDAVSDDA